MLRSALCSRFFAPRRASYLQLSPHLNGLAFYTSTSVKPQTHSIVSGPLDPPLAELTFPAYYKEHILAKYDSRPALISRHEANVRWTFAEFDTQIERMARGLLAAGVKPGDRVATILGNCSAYGVLQWACARIGVILVTMNPAYKMHEILAALNNVTASTLIIAPSIRKSPFLGMIKEALSTLSSTRAGRDIDEPELPSLRRIFVVDNTGDRALFKSQMDSIPCAVDLAEVANARYGAEPEKEASILQRMDRHDVVNLQFTSGTTGLPKAVSLTHRNLLNNALSIGRCMRLSSQDILCNVPPLFHCFDKYSPPASTVLGNLAAWVHGAAIVYPSETFDPKAIVQTISDERCTALHGVPTHFIGVLEELERRGNDSGLNMSSLRTGIAAGSPVPIDLMRQLIAKMNLRDLTIAYGMTETSPVSFQTTPEDPLETRVETVGRIHPHVRAKIIGQNGELAPIGTAGELCVAGYLVQKGYWMNPEQTNAVMKRDEEDPNILWMHTGDQAVIDQEGYLKITGRIKDLIIRGGENLSPVQIENCLTSHPDIVEAAAIAVPDARFGEVVGVWILLRRGATPLSQQDVTDWVKVKMNPQNAPSFVWFLSDGDIPSELPKTGSGKVMKNVLRDGMGTGKPKTLKCILSISDILARFAREESPDTEFTWIFPPSFNLSDENHFSQCAKPGLPSCSCRYSPRQLKNGSTSTKGEEPLNLTKHIHPEGRPYFQQDKFTTSDDMQDPEIGETMPQALALVCRALKQTSENQSDSNFQHDIEFCIELESLTSPPEFNYYLVDHTKHSIFWVGTHRPTGIQQANDITRVNMLREEYWKHVEYYPCHRCITPEDYRELTQLLAASATDSATSEGSTSPMSAADIRSHLEVLRSFDGEQSAYKTWAVARLFGLFIRGQIVNRYGAQDARLDRFASLDSNPPRFQGQYSVINSHLTMGLGDLHLIRCSRTWADRIAYTEAWRGYKRSYLKEWREIRYLACVILIICSNFHGHATPLFTFILVRAAAATALLSAVFSYYLSNTLANVGDHAADAALYFQRNEEAYYRIQRLSLLNCAPQAGLIWSTGFLVLAVLT